MMQHRILAPIDPAPIDAELLEVTDAGARMRALPAAELRALPADALAAWCGMRARYGLVTAELVGFLRDLIGWRDGVDADHAIEIGAGMGDLGYRVGIHMTDSAMQTRPEIRDYYRSLGQPIIDPPPDVERLDALAAIQKYRPKIVIGSWCTQLYRDGDTPKRIGSSMYGVDEEWIIRNVDVYVHVGNDGPHAGKRIYAARHETVRPPWLVSRAADQALNCVRIWRR